MKISHSLIGLLIVVLVLFRGAGLSHAVAKEGGSQKSMTLTYEVTPGDSSTTVDIFVDFPSPNLVLGFYNAPVDLRKSIQEIAADDNEGHSLRVFPGGSNTWRIQNWGKKVHVRYTIGNIVPYEGGLPYKKEGNEVAVYITKEGGILDGRYFFLVPLRGRIKTIQVKWNVPSGWRVVCPYKKEGDYFIVPQITQDIRHDFVARQGIYFGSMKYYAETTALGVKVEFGVLSFDRDWEFQSSGAQEAVETYAQQAAQAIEKFSQIFGESPYPIFTFYSNFQAGGWVYPGTREIVGGYQYWPKGRYSELIGHLLYSWLSFWNGASPVVAHPLIAKGLGEEYLGSKLAYDITGEEHYLGQLYSYYLVYARAYGTSYYEKNYAGGDEIVIYYKGAVLGMYLDHLIQQETHGQKSLEDVFGYLYQRYKNSGHVVTPFDLQRALDQVTGKSHADIFGKYVYGNQRIPVEDFLTPYEKAFPSFIQELQRDFPKNYQGSIIPYFVDVEMALPLAYHLPFGILIEPYYQQFADYMKTHYDVDKLTEQNVDEALTHLTKHPISGFFERWRNIYKNVTVEEMKQWLEGKLDAAFTREGAGVSEMSSVPLEGALIRADGRSDDWPEIGPFKTDPKEPSIADDITAFYTLEDTQYLYLRLDGRFSSSPPAQLTFDMWLKPFSGESRRIQVSTEISAPTTLHVVPLDNEGQPIFDKQVMYVGCAFSATTYEAVIPWKILGKLPKELVIRPYIVGQGHIIEDLSQVDIAYFLTPTVPSSFLPTPTPTPRATASVAVFTPTITSFSTPVPVNRSTLPRWWYIGLFLVIAIIIGGWYWLRNNKHV